MNMIRNYLESMFAALPNTAEVRRAKDELGQMMEDKFSELIGQGVSENEAIATVISEFGNLNEIAADLGIDETIARKNADGRYAITMDVAKDYMLDINIFALRVSLGIALMILSPIMPILGGNGSMSMGLSLAGMFMLIFGGIFLIILGTSHFSKWKFIRRNPCFMDFQTYNYVENESSKFNSTYAFRLVLGIMLNCICWLPLVILVDNSSLMNRIFGSAALLGLALLFTCVAFGVMLIVDSGMIKLNYSLLLHVNDKKTISGSYGHRYQNDAGMQGGVSGQPGQPGMGAQAGQPGQSSQAGQPGQPGMGAQAGQPGQEPRNYEKLDGWGKTIVHSYWPIVTCIYLVYSFMTMHWATTWLIWPVAAAARPFVSKALKNK
ncbi:MAG: permease prefix domain 1-containing protein [Lachnospiraceae bacterium]|nr:permease prefix domain 1-containing protein [Lachnospiraceae bacterium]